MRVDCFCCIRRAAWIKAALAADKWAQAQLVEADGEQQQAFHRWRCLTRGRSAQYSPPPAATSPSALQPAFDRRNLRRHDVLSKQTFMTIKRRLLQMLLVALLLVAQHVALTHGFNHLPLGQLSQLEQTQQDDSGTKSPSGLCDFHVAVAQVFSALSSSALPVGIAVGTDETVGHVLALTHTALFLAPLSRGPPALL